METHPNAEGASPALGPKSALCHLPSLLRVCHNSGNRELPRTVALGKEVGEKYISDEKSETKWQPQDFCTLWLFLHLGTVFAKAEFPISWILVEHSAYCIQLYTYITSICITVMIILKCSKVLYYTTQLRLSSCWVFCIFLIVLLVFNSVPIYDYSKNHRLYHRKANVIPGNWENQ